MNPVPLLTWLGKQARITSPYCLNSQRGRGNWVDAFVDHFLRTYLGKIQSDIFFVEPIATQYELAADDESVQIHVCHSSINNWKC